MKRFFNTSDGAQLAFVESGEGLPLIALAGLTRDSKDFNYLERRVRSLVRLIRLDCRGRGDSSWTGCNTYNIARETEDVFELMDYLSIERAGVIGSSRGGLIGMMMAHLHKDRLLGLCLNDVGPVLERKGLERIAAYVGKEPAVKTLEEIADRMEYTMPGFHRVPELRWAEETLHHYHQLDGRVGFSYDPAIRTVVTEALKAPLSELWDLFDQLSGLPLALIRGANSDVLSQATALEMQKRRPDMLYVEVNDRGHVPFLDEPEAVHCIVSWIDQMKRWASTH